MRKIEILSKILIIFMMFQLILSPTQVKAGFWSDLFSQSEDLIEKGKKAIQEDEKADREERKRTE